MNITLLLPRARHHAVESSYGSTQTRLLLGRQIGAAPTLVYESGDTATEVLSNVTSDLAIVVTDPTLVPGTDLVRRLVAAIEAEPTVDAAVPTTAGIGGNEIAETGPFFTIRQFESLTSGLDARTEVTTVSSGDDPGIALIRVARFQSATEPSTMLEGHRVAVDRAALVYRYAPQQAFRRDDLLERTPENVESVLDLGCGEGLLGAALKARQNCRVVGIELDRDAAAIAATRIDEVHSEDARAVIPALAETFDWIVAGDVIEHVSDPWALLRDLRRVASPDSRILASIPNVGAWPIVEDLLLGRFDYTYAGNLCAGHLRFFTRSTIEDLLAMSGWTLDSITPHTEIRTPAFEELIARLAGAGIAHSAEDLATLGYHVVARARAGKA